MELTALERDALARGQARIFRGRVVPVVQGGATYAPAALISQKTMGNGIGAIATWEYQNTLGAGDFGVARTLSFSGQGGTTGAVTVQTGVTGATGEADQTLLDAVPLTANAPYILNGWWVVPNSSFLAGYADNTTTSGGAYGVTYS